MARPLASFLADPHWYLDDIDVDGGKFVVANATRESLSQATFLDQRWLGRGARAELAMDATIALLDQHRPEDVAAPRFIWHTAFCCSTLVARAIDVAGLNLSLKEPDAIEKLANIKRIQHRRAQDPAVWRKLLRATVELCSRPFEPGEKVSIKPSNSANILILEILAQYPAGKALLLYSDLRSFLISILKKREHGRHFARKMFTAFAMDENFLRGLPGKDLLRLTDLQVAAMGWLVQLEIFQEAIARFPGSQVMTLDAEALLADPTGVLLRLDEFFEIGLGAARIAEIVSGPVFKNNAKNLDESFAAGQRSNEALVVEAVFGSDLDLIVNWAAKQWSHLRPLERLPRGLAAA